MENSGEYVQASEREKLEELETFVENIRVPSIYDGMHALNPVHYRFDTGDEAMRACVLADIRRILDTYTDEELEAAVDRRSMEEQVKPHVPVH